MCKEIGGVRFYTASEVAVRAKLSRQTIWRWAKARIIPSFRDLSGRMYFPEGIVRQLSSRDRMEPVLPITDWPVLTANAYQLTEDDQGDLIPAPVASAAARSQTSS